jgi:hypothetical protein
MNKDQAQRLRRVEEVAEHSVAMRKLQERFPDALTVSDAMTEKTLFVSAADVARAVPKDPSRCAVAQCAQREGLGALIGQRFAFLIEGGHVTRYHLQKDAQVLTAFFDKSAFMRPGEVLLSVPPPSTRLGMMKKRERDTAAARRTRRAKKRTTQSTRQRQQLSDARRRVISTRGFRSWDQVEIPARTS